MPVHYAGVGCEMDAIMEIAQRHGLLVIEDAAQGICRDLQRSPAGRHRTLAALSLPRDQEHHFGRRRRAADQRPARCVERAEIIREKGTNRSQFFRGQVDKYTWVDVGSSFLPGEIVAAFLWAQMEAADDDHEAAAGDVGCYHRAFATSRAAGKVRRPIVPRECQSQRAHVLPAVADLERRDAFIARLKAGV